MYRRAPLVIKLLVQVIALFFALLTHGDDQEPATPALIEIETRINQGDYEVINEIAQLPINDAIARLASIISIYTKTTSGKDHPEVPRLAAEAIARIPGHVDHLLAILKQETNRPFSYRDRESTIDLIRRVGTVEAVTAVGNLLSDTTVIETPEQLKAATSTDYEPPFGPNAQLAAKTLNRMNLPTAPTRGLEASRPGAAEKWREWWAENKDHIDELLASNQTPQPLPNSTPPAPNENLIGKAPPPEKPTTPTEAPEAEKNNTLLYVLLGLLVVAGIAIAVTRAARKQ